MKFVITVKFVIKAGHESEFLQRILVQAQESLSLEEGCHCFDVLVHTNDPDTIFLYEIYESEAAFAAHLESCHFLSFDSEVADWVASKTVERWNGPMS
jgi:(4S)-4-hydroxy-5-phosphonooxypentane-2,3-dione isomerase